MRAPPGARYIVPRGTTIDMGRGLPHGPDDGLGTIYLPPPADIRIDIVEPEDVPMS